MAKLTRAQANLHSQAEALLAMEGPLDDDQRQFVLDHWQGTVHGGQHNDLSVEVSAWRRSRTGHSRSIVVCNEEPPADWQGVGVYIRNPLAFHVHDSPILRGGAENALRAAFAYADALADHLGCTVESRLTRPAA